VSPDTPFNLALGAALGLLVGVVGLVVREARDNTVRTAAELNELASAPVLAEIAHDRHVPSRPLIVDEPFVSARAEAFRKLRTNLQFRDRDGDHRVIVVTSARVGEGSSSTACNLAVAMAEAGNRVLLLDANLRDPRVADYLGLDPFPGLVDVLVGRVVWQYARQRWNRGGFDALTAGPYPHNHSQLLASSSLADLLDDMRKHYDFIVVDTPALLAVSDGAAVAARADGVVLVVQHRQTSQDQVTAAVEALNAVSARLLGTVLTMTKGRLRKEGRVPSYQVPVSTARRDGSLPATLAPTEVTSPPTGFPRTIPEQAGTNGAQQEGGAEAPTRPVDKPKRRPSPTPRR
jgi:non-specific protein-tyrosine kinase